MMKTSRRSHTFEGVNPPFVEDVEKGGRRPPRNNSTLMDTRLLAGDGNQSATNRHKLYALGAVLLVFLAAVAVGCFVLLQSSPKDIDVCKGDHGCHTCNNTDSGFVCGCDEGFTTEGGDGFECLVDMCNSGHVLSERSMGGAADGKDGYFGRSVATMGDLDGDGVPDLAVGGDHGEYDDHGEYRGAVYILFMNEDGSVKGEHKISSTQEGGLVGLLDDYDYFGISVAAVGDLDGDGVVDLAVGAIGDDDGGKDRGAMYILFMTKDGSVKEVQKISSTNQGGSVGPARDDWEYFGTSVAAVGDLDGDGVVDLVVGASAYSGDGGKKGRGAVYIFFMNADGSAKVEQKISLVGPRDDEEMFGTSVAAVGDLDGNGVVDLAVGAKTASDGGYSQGAVYIVFMNEYGSSVKGEQKISSTQGGLVGPLHDYDAFGTSVAAVGDLDGDGVVDLAVGAAGDGDGDGGVYSGRGALYILLLNADGSVKGEQKISSTQGQAALVGLDVIAHFGSSATLLGDLDGNGVMSLAVGANRVNRVFVLEVPPGFVSVCAAGETCVNTADSTYSYECTTE